MPARTLAALALLAATASAGCAGRDLAPAPEPAPVVTLDRTPVAEPLAPIARVVKRGRGPVPMILVPRAAGDERLFEPFMQRNEHRYTFYAVTLPGFGGTEPPEPADPAQFRTFRWLDSSVAALARMIDERGLDRPVILGVELGGHLAIRFALAHPDRTRGIITLDGQYRLAMLDPRVRYHPEDMPDVVEETLLPDMINETDLGLHEMQRASIEQDFPDDAETAETLIEMATTVRARVLARYRLELSAADLTYEVGRMTVPMLAIHSTPTKTGTRALALHEHRLNNLREMFRREYANIPTARLVLFEGVDGWLTHAAPEVLDEAVAAFVEGRYVRGIPPVPSEVGPPPEDPRIAPPPVLPEGMDIG